MPPSSKTKKLHLVLQDYGVCLSLSNLIFFRQWSNLLVSTGVPFKWYAGSARPAQSTYTRRDQNVRLFGSAFLSETLSTFFESDEVAPASKSADCDHVEYR